MTASTTESTVAALLTSGKGILAADESQGTIEKRFKALDIPCTEDNRRAYREMLFTTPRLGEFISGVILFDETLRQKGSDGTPLADLLVKAGIIPGIKVDLGTASLVNFGGEKFTQGLDGLRERLGEYRGLGARFTKWRAVINIGTGTPSRTCLETNARLLAMFAALSQEAGLVPIVEPEVLMDGDHTLAQCESVIGMALETVFGALYDHRVILEQMLLKSGMVLPGTGYSQPVGNVEIAEATLRCFRRSVPVAVPGIVFLSGGQRDKEATERLNMICRGNSLPWKLTFSYGRALQDMALSTWKGNPGQVPAAQTALLHRARCNGLAVQGKYSTDIETGDGPAK